MDLRGIPRLSDFGLSSVTWDIESVNASTPHHGCTIQYCAPELLDVGNTIKDVKRKSTNKSDVYSLSMVIVGVLLFHKGMIRPDSYCFCFQLVTGKMPFPEYTDHNVSVMVSKGKRPPKPFRFKAPGMTSEVWKIAEKCWHQKAKKRPEANLVLRSLENLLKPGMLAHEAYFCP